MEGLLSMGPTPSSFFLLSLLFKSYFWWKHRRLRVLKIRFAKAYKLCTRAKLTWIFCLCLPACCRYPPLLCCISSLRWNRQGHRGNTGTGRVTEAILAQNVTNTQKVAHSQNVALYNKFCCYVVTKCNYLHLYWILNRIPSSSKSRCEV